MIAFEWSLVNRHYREQGIAKRMHKLAEKLAASQGVRKIRGDSRVSNYQAIALERGLGIRTIGKLKKHWFRQDYILWEKQQR